MDAAAQQRCFECAAKARFTSTNAGGCASCFYGWVGSARERCLDCVESQSTPQSAKSSCAYCVGNGRSQQAGDTCVACLKTGASDVQNTCVNAAGR
jgi:hypothetical protein